MGYAEFGLGGYKVFRKDRLIKRGGGGGGGKYEIQIEAEADFSEAIWCSLESQGSTGYIVAHQLVRMRTLGYTTLLRMQAEVSD